MIDSGWPWAAVTCSMCFRLHSNNSSLIITCKFSLCHNDRYWEHLRQASHRVWNVHNSVVFDYLRDEISVTQVVADGHSYTENTRSWEVGEKILDHSLMVKKSTQSER